MSVYWDHEHLRRAGKSPGVLLVGDSWFWFPFGNMAHSFAPLCGPWEAVEVHGGNGLRVKDVGVGGRTHSQAVKTLRTFRTIKAVGVSLGGNDLVGGNLRKVLKPDCRGIAQAWSCFDFERFGEYLVEVANKVSRFAAALRDAGECPAFVHGYDYPRAIRRGWFGMDRVLTRTLNVCRVDPRLRDEVLRVLVNVYNLELSDACRRELVGYVDLRGALATEGDWLDEIHPTARQFRCLGERMRLGVLEVLEELEVLQEDR
jgi:hypothetical protein